MLVVIANNLPDAIRGRIKLWFIEPRPNVFLSEVKSAVAKKVVDYLYQYCPVESGLITFRQISKPPGYEIRGIGGTKRNLVDISGLQLIIEKMGNEINL